MIDPTDFCNLFATVYYLIGTVVSYYMQYIVATMRTVVIGKVTRETLLFLKIQTENALHIKNNHQTVPMGP